MSSDLRNGHMTLKTSTGSPHRPAGEKAIIVAVGSGPAAMQVVEAGKQIADGLRKAWEAVHVETPSGDRHGEDPAMAAEALGLAARSGATIAKVPAATVAAGLALHLDGSGADQLVMGNSRRGPRLFARRSLLEKITHLRPDLTVHLVPVERERRVRRRWANEASSLRDYGYALGSVALTLALALILNRAGGVRSISILFLFPVIAAAARLGTKPALAAAFLSVAGFNFFFLEPTGMLKPGAIQSWVMGTVLVVVALYTGAVTASLRDRSLLSERSAQENARIAAFALELTRVADWAGTAQVICTEMSALLDVRSVLVREISGELEIAASEPAGANLETLDKAALDWAWSNGEPAGSGSSILSSANWQLRPLKTSLGTLAVLGLARDDGRNPVPADRMVLLSTLTAQAALALERLRLEDQMRAGAQEA